MSPPDRIRRPKPARSEPIRGGWLSLFGPPDLRAEPGSASAPEDEEAGAPGDPVARAVALGYRVVDEYIRQGQNAARLLARRSYGPQAIANDVQEVAARVVQYGAEFMDVWMQLLGQAAIGQPDRARDGAGAPPQEELRPRGASGPQRNRGGSQIALAIESAQPIRVQLDVSDVSGRRLEVQALQSTESGRPPIRGAHLGGTPPCLRLRVPPDQPAGTYAGVVLDGQTGDVAGTLIVIVGGGDA